MGGDLWCSLGGRCSWYWGNSGYWDGGGKWMGWRREVDGWGCGWSVLRGILSRLGGAGLVDAMSKNASIGC